MLKNIGNTPPVVIPPQPPIASSLWNTQDYVFLQSREEVENYTYDDRVVYPSDYAVMNGAFLFTSASGPGARMSTSYYLRTVSYDSLVDCVSTFGMLGAGPASVTGVGLCPCLHLDLDKVISARYSSLGFRIKPFEDEGGKILYHTIEFGEYPQDKASNSAELEKLFAARKLTPTGKNYTGYMKKPGVFRQHQEFEYGSKKYVRVISTKFDNNSLYKDNTKAPKKKTPIWAEVQPIKWRILNYDELPRDLNPKGTETANTLYVRSEDVLMSGIPFSPGNSILDTGTVMWQNSPLRAFLNSYDLEEQINNGNGKQQYSAGLDFGFKDCGFLEEAFDMDINLTQTQNRQSTPLPTQRPVTVKVTTEVNPQSETQANTAGMPQSNRKTRLEKLNPDNTPTHLRRRMTDTETIKSWIDAGQSVLLRGPSGIGKTQRLKKLYPDLIYIKLTNNMFPEKVVGSMNLQTGQPIPPDFAKQAFLTCATDEEKKLIQENIQNLYDLADTIYERSKSSTDKVVIMLDELLNVKPAVQALVYTLVLNKLVETGKGLKLPANTVVVATGNQKKYSAVAEDLAEPLEKRFDHILDMEPKVGEWLYEYAVPSKLHPSVIGYIFSKYQEKGRSEKISKMGYFYEEPKVGEEHLDRNGCRGRTNDPRGWESISNTLYAFEEDLQQGKFVGKNVEALLKLSIGSKLREEWAEEFFDFYNNPTPTAEDIFENRYTSADLPRDINEKFATMAGLLSATEQQVGACRDFIRKYCDPEYLSVYDIYWAGNDEQRMEKIAELREISAIELENEGSMVR